MMYNSFSAQNLSSLSLFKWAGEPLWNIIWVNIVLYALKILKLGRGSNTGIALSRPEPVPSQPEACCLSSRIQCWQLWLTRAKGGAMRIPWCSHVKANRLSRMEYPDAGGHWLCCPRAPSPWMSGAMPCKTSHEIATGPAYSTYVQWIAQDGKGTRTKPDDFRNYLIHGSCI